MTGTRLLYLYPNRPRAGRYRRIDCWCRAQAAWAVVNFETKEPRMLCGVHATEYAKEHGLALPVPPEGEGR